MTGYDELIDRVAQALRFYDKVLPPVGAWQEASVAEQLHYRRTAEVAMAALGLQIQHGQLMRRGDEDSILTIDDPIAGRAAAEVFHMEYIPRIRYTTPWMEDPDASTDEQPLDVPEEPQPPAA